MTADINQRMDAPAKPWWRSLYIQVVIAIILGVLIGHFDPALGTKLKILGDGFIKLVRMTIAPVIFLTLTIGIAKLGDLGGLARVAGKAFIWFFAFSTLALIVGLTVANVVQPGAGLHIDPITLNGKGVETYAAKAHAQSLGAFLLNIIPETLVSAVAQGEILQVLLVAVLTGTAALAAGERAEPLIGVLEAANVVVFNIIRFIMVLAPIGALGAMAYTVGAYGAGTLANLAALVATFYATAALFVFGVLGLAARFIGFSIFRLIAYLKAELLLVLGTSSSEPALPSLIEKLERAGCPPSVVGLVVPTGYSFNLDGTNIYMTLAALFIAQATDVHLSIGQQALLLVVAMISSKGAAGVTGSGFVTLAATLAIVPSVPVAGIALILGIDRFMSECRSLTNFIGNAVATVAVSAWEGNLDRERFNAALAPSRVSATQ
jgi:aerobic C4-dicarboxylate transport protein